LLRRLAVAAIITLVIATMLLTLPGARQAGATILASAGVLGIVAGLAAQSSLSNLFAGLQLAFTDAIRVDDVVVVETEWGRIEEITLTYVVVHIWDDRRLILPSTYFTTTPFQNWTRKESAVLGSIELDVDWRVPLADLRAELDRALSASEIWDERVGILQVTNAVGSFVRLRVLVSGVDGPTVWDLRCEVREALVNYLQRFHPTALPRVRVERDEPSGTDRSTRPADREMPAQPGAAAEATQPMLPAELDPLATDPFETEASRTQGLFTGSREAIARARGFGGGH
jgi:small-conductance mechanosensitive channel